MFHVKTHSAYLTHSDGQWRLNLVFTNDYSSIHRYVKKLSLFRSITMAEALAVSKRWHMSQRLIKEVSDVK